MRGACVLFHGMTGEPYEMGELGEILIAKGYEVSIPLLPGHRTSIEDLCGVHTNTFVEVAEDALLRAAGKVRGGVFIAGLSFGALISLLLAERCSSLVKGAALLSLPFKFRSPVVEAGLSMLSCLPEFVLDQLPVKAKTKRLRGSLAIEQRAYPVHSMGAGARVVSLRRTAIKNLDQVRAPLLALYDPRDHLVSKDSVKILADGVKNTSLDVVAVPKGEHELTLGHSRALVISEVVKFFDSLSER